jgi:hypothetical protein
MEKKEISMVISSGLFIVGVMVGDNKILNPRMFTMFEAVEDGKKVPKMQLSPLPSNPPVIYVRPEVRYRIPDWDAGLLRLYEKVTAPIKVAQEGQVELMN